MTDGRSAGGFFVESVSIEVPFILGLSGEIISEDIFGGCREVHFITDRHAVG